MVDCSALEECLTHLPRVQQSSYCKLLHGILNTKAQNNRFYGKSNLCPICNLFPETMQDVFHCQHKDIVQFCETQHTTLWAGILLGDNPFPIQRGNNPCLPPTSYPSSPHPSTVFQRPTGDHLLLASISENPETTPPASCGNSNDTSSVKTGNSNNVSSIDTYSATVKRAVTQQTNDIGWTQFHQGRLSSQ
jgi:hypothetical protein